MSKEERARNIISHALGLSVRLTDVQTHLGLHDLEIDLSDGKVEAVEVTTLTDQDLERLHGSIRKYGTTIGTPEGTLSWQVSLDDTAQLNRLQAMSSKLATALEAIESDGIRLFTVERDRHRSKPVEALANDFPMITGGWSWPPQNHHVIVAAGPSHASGVSPELLNEVITSFLAAPKQEDVRRKLRVAGTAKRHAFVWVERHAFPAWASMCEDDLPLGPPSFPTDITDVWLATTCPNGSVLVWTADSGGWARVQ